MRYHPADHDIFAALVVVEQALAALDIALTATLPAPHLATATELLGSAAAAVKSARRHVEMQPTR